MAGCKYGDVAPTRGVYKFLLDPATACCQFTYKALSKRFSKDSNTHPTDSNKGCLLLICEFWLTLLWPQHLLFTGPKNGGQLIGPIEDTNQHHLCFTNHILAGLGRSQYSRNLSFNQGKTEVELEEEWRTCYTYHCRTNCPRPHTRLFFPEDAESDNNIEALSTPPLTTQRERSSGPRRSSRITSGSTSTSLSPLVEILDVTGPAPFPMNPSSPTLSNHVFHHLVLHQCQYHFFLNHLITDLLSQFHPMFYQLDKNRISALLRSLRVMSMTGAAQIYFLLRTFLVLKEILSQMLQPVWWWHLWMCTELKMFLSVRSVFNHSLIQGRYLLVSFNQMMPPLSISFLFNTGCSVGKQIPFESCSLSYYSHFQWTARWWFSWYRSYEGCSFGSNQDCIGRHFRRFEQQRWLHDSISKLWFWP